ncbi:hypothetical protein LEP1GSC062_2533 [Leptospira alexanderi serovar Manhao 3 str. L 60]|uniref:Uncharacterized protein n=1 Tax=Leptospira alexanderi serovar Manhao 3 str. L 60 TaxID=1049759 RepID=V6I130_9LEPT|nr:hypothetical protein LEP1GSC062_2533 [Leptospira alexanderi serovar Manhao 3 str. L 60]
MKKNFFGGNSESINLFQFTKIRGGRTLSVVVLWILKYIRRNKKADLKDRLFGFSKMNRFID